MTQKKQAIQPNHFVVIMAGGTGTRFWPYSRKSRPKQFLDILGTGKSLLRITYERFIPVCNPENIFIVTNQEYADLVEEIIPEIATEQILLEPVKKNTAPCIALASYKIRKKNPDAIITVTPADHMIFQEDKFFKALSVARDGATDQGKLITIGIRPSRPETGYGYIQYIPGKEVLKKVKTFTEKPEAGLAQKFLESGEFVWNAGIFIWHVNAIIDALNHCLPEIGEVFEEIQNEFYTDGEEKAIFNAYSQTKNISIDYGVMEKAPNVYVVLGSFSWSDLGSWNTLHELSEQDTEKNVVKANAILYDTEGCYVQAPMDKLLVVKGLKNYLITENEKVILICPKDDEKAFKDFTIDVKKQKGDEYL